MGEKQRIILLLVFFLASVLHALVNNFMLILTAGQQMHIIVYAWITKVMPRSVRQELR